MGIDIKGQMVCKPGSVRSKKRDDHSSRTIFAYGLMQPTRTADLKTGHHAVPIRSCSGRGLPMPFPLPKKRCALTAPFHPYLPRQAVIFCGAFPRIAPAGRYPASCFHGARTFLTLVKERDRPTIWPKPMWSLSQKRSRLLPHRKILDPKVKEPLPLVLGTPSNHRRSFPLGRDGAK